jgi:hypothetical protein
MGVLPYDFDPVAAPILINIEALDLTVPDLPIVEVNVQLNAIGYLNLNRVELLVTDANTGLPVLQAGNTPTATSHALHDFYVDAPWVDFEAWNFAWSHKDSSSFPWSCGLDCFDDVCPHLADHGASYANDSHLVNPGADPLVQDFNGVSIAPNQINRALPISTAPLKTLPGPNLVKTTPVAPGVGIQATPALGILAVAPIPYILDLQFTGITGLPNGADVCVQAVATNVRGATAYSSVVCGP